MSTDDYDDRLQIRPATADDVPAIVQLLADDQLGSTRETPTDPLPDAYLQAFAAIERQEGNQVVVAELDGRVVGTLQLTLLPHLAHQGAWRAQIEAVRVHREMRSQGLGEQLLRWAIDEARARDCRLVQLTTDSSRANAHRFYEALGFRATHVGMKLAINP